MTEKQKPGRPPWPDDDKTGKQLAERILIAINGAFGQKKYQFKSGKFKLAALLRDLFKIPREQSTARQAHDRWHETLVGEWIDQLEKDWNQPSDNNNKPPPGDRAKWPKGMIWKDGAWQDPAGVPSQEIAAGESPRYWTENGKLMCSHSPREVMIWHRFKAAGETPPPKIKKD